MIDTFTCTGMCSDVSQIECCEHAPFGNFQCFLAAVFGISPGLRICWRAKLVQHLKCTLELSLVNYAGWPGLEQFVDFAVAKVNKWKWPSGGSGKVGFEF